jgi:uncharacterized protein
MIKLLTEEHKDIVLEYLEKHHIETTFLIGNVNCFGLDNNPEMRRCGDYYGYFEDGVLRGVLPFYNLGSCIPHYDSVEAIPYFAVLLRQRTFEFLLGMEKIIKPLYSHIKFKKHALEYSESSYYVNKNLKPFYLEGITIMDADITNPSIVEFFEKARLEGFHNKRASQEVINTIKYNSEEEDFILLLKDNKIVAQACIQTTTSMINQIGGVFTTPDERGHGYCKAVVSEICSRIVSRGKTPTLMVRKNNIPAVKAYSALGFQYCDDYLIIRF